MQIWNCQIHQQNNLSFLTDIVHSPLAFLILNVQYTQQIQEYSIKKITQNYELSQQLFLTNCKLVKRTMCRKNHTVWKISPKFSVFLNQRFCTFFNTLKVLKSWHAKMTFTDCNKFKEKIAPFFTKLTICTVIQNTIFGTQYISVFAEHSVEISGFFCHSNFT